MIQQKYANKKKCRMHHDEYKFMKSSENIKNGERMQNETKKIMMK